MKTNTKTRRIAQHGANLLAIYPNAAERDPAKLVARLRRLEIAANGIVTRYTNGELSDKESDAAALPILEEARGILGAGASIALNWEPRGYSLKIDADAARSLTIFRDMGGGGIIAPDLSGND